MLKRYSFFGLLLALLTLSACKPKTNDHRPVLTVSIEPLRYFVEQIAGNRFRVETLVPAGASPETYEPTPSQMVDLSNSHAYFCVGTLGFENTLLSRLTQSNPALPLVKLNKGVSLLSDTHHHDAGGTDPHIWMSTVNAAIMAQTVYEALCRLDGPSRNYYTQRFTQLKRHIAALDDTLRHELAQADQRTFIIYHPSLGYFARDFGFRQLPVEVDGKEATAEHLMELTRTARANRVKVVFIQKEFSGKTARELARQTGLRTLQINPLSYHWTDEMQSVARALTQQ